MRRQRYIDVNRSAFSATGTAYDCSFQDLAPEKVQLYNGIIGKTYEVFVPDSNSDILIGDEVVIRNITYSVRGIEVIDFGGLPFLDLIVVRNDA